MEVTALSKTISVPSGKLTAHEFVSGMRAIKAGRAQPLARTYQQCLRVCIGREETTAAAPVALAMFGMRSPRETAVA